LTNQLNLPPTVSENRRRY